MSPWWLRPVPVQDEPRHALGKWVVLLSVVILAATLNLVFAVLKFTDGQGWVGAWHLGIAILSGSLAAKAIVEIWKRRRIEPPEEKMG